jgi:hypothetical protein
MNLPQPDSGPDSTINSPYYITVVQNKIPVVSSLKKSTTNKGLLYTYTGTWKLLFSFHSVHSTGIRYDLYGMYRVM